MLRTTVLVITITCMHFCPAFADDSYDEMLFGTYSGESTAARATYGTVVVTKENISWRGEAGSLCKATYSIVSKGTNEPCPSMSTSSPETGCITFKLKPGASECTQGIGYLMFSFQAYFHPTVELVEYEKNGQIRNITELMRNFERLKKP